MSAVQNRVFVASRRDLDEAVLDAVREVLPWAISNLDPPEPEPPQEVLSNGQTMEFMDVSKSTLQRWRDKGILPYSKIGSSIYYKREDLIRVVEEHRVGATNGHA